MALDFPSSPTNGQVYTSAGGQRWQYESSSTSWKALGIAANISLSKATPLVILSKTASGQAAGLFGQTNGLTRWAVQVGNANAESGSNTGSDFSIDRYSDALVRHLVAESFEKFDNDSQILHAAHAAWNALARLELMLRERAKP